MLRVLVEAFPFCGEVLEGGKVEDDRCSVTGGNGVMFSGGVCLNRLGDRFGLEYFVDLVVCGVVIFIVFFVIFLVIGSVVVGVVGLVEVRGGGPGDGCLDS